MNVDIKNYKNRHSFGSKIARVLWRVIWFVFASWTPDHAGLWIFNQWRILLLRIFGAKIGKKCAVFSSVECWAPWNMVVGNRVAISARVNCYSVDKIVIGDNAVISEDAFLDCASHDIASPIMELTYAPITIGANAWVAARAIVLPGRTVGEGAVVAAGAVVTKDVEPWTVVGGNPAKVIKRRELIKAN